ncbi:MAG: leucine-rich repeat protein, partial [Ruminococcus sp.]|nr:leucine-rich repeat protein [Ruminococcus sp.]
GTTALKTVTLSNDLTFLGYAAFKKSGLTAVTIPENVTLAQDSWRTYETFMECPNLTTVTVNNSYIGKNEFKECPKLTTVNLGTKIITIGENAFYKDAALTTVNNYGNPLYLGKSAFEGCSALKAINLGSRLIFVGSDAFLDDTSLTTVRIPSTVTTFGENDWREYSLFEGCTNLKDVYIANASMKTDGAYDMFKNVTAFTINTIQDSPAYKYATNNVYSKKTFTAIPSTAIAFNNSNYTLVNGETLRLYPELTPANSTDSYTYISGDTSVAEVDIYGGVTAKKTGLVQIQVTTSSGKKAVCTINVVASGTSSKDAPKTKSISLCTVTIPNVSYTGSALTPAATVLFNPTIELVKDVDYTISYKNNVEIGTATATITGKGNYTGTLQKTFKITGDITKSTVSGLSDVTYNGAEQKPAPTVKIGATTLAADTDYTLTYSNNTNAGTATVTITGKGNYTGKVTKQFKINPTSISKATVSGLSSKTYTGKALTQKPTVKLGSKTLKAGTDYTVSYKNNKAVGKATVTITGKGNYNGTVKATFKICPKKTTVKKLTSPKTKQLKVTYGKVAGVTGYQITYSTSSKFTKKTTKSANAAGTSKTIKKLTKGKTYYVKVRTYKTVGKTKYYSGYSAVKKIKVK